MPQPPPVSTARVVHTTGQRLDTMLTGLQTDGAGYAGAIAALQPHVGGAPWTATADGSAVHVDLAGAASLAAGDYLVTVSGIDQTGAFAVAPVSGGVRLTFPEAPPAGVRVVARHLTQHARTT